MNISLLDSIISSDWLKYGFTGLAAIFGVLMYLIFKPLVLKGRNNKLWVFLFVGISLIILTMGGFYVYSGDRLTATSNKTVDSLKLHISSLEEKLQIYSEGTPTIRSLVEKIALNKQKLDSLNKVNENLEKNVEIQQSLITGLVSKSLIESIANDMTSTSGKGQLSLDYPDVEFKRLQRAVFLNFYSFNGNKAILKQALNALQKQTGELKTSSIDRILALFSPLMRQRYNWLKNEAIPQLEENIRFLGANPNIQESAHAAVKLPKEIWVIPIENKYCNIIYCTDLTALSKEKELLGNKLIE